ncbi:MAG: SAM-dependent methyltransferase [Marinoscillum sp.]
MVISALKLNVAIKDDEFDEIYPRSVRQKSKIHWTPVDVAKMAAHLLVDRPGVKVLDTGSGAGKFCLVGAALTKGVFTGVEQRKYLANLSNGLFRKYGLSNASAIHANITSVDFKLYDAFYFYNPFMENIRRSGRIDDTVSLTIDNYKAYIRYVREQLKELPYGTRVVTYCSNGLKIPLGYCKIASHENGLLDLWVKRSSSDSF